MRKGVLILLILSFFQCKSQIISLFAGTGTRGCLGDGGLAVNAQFQYPYFVIADSLGNIYVADADSNMIRRIDTNGIITKFAGTGTPGYTGDGGQAINATLNNPRALAIDAIGNIYVAEANNNVVRKINTSGIITTVAGTGVVGYSGNGGLATNAKLDYPIGIAIDGMGNLFIADHDNEVIRKVNSSSGIITTIAGTAGIAGYSGDGGLATNAKLYDPWAICLDALDNLYIADASNSRIRKVNNSGIISTVIGTGVWGYTGDGGQAINAQLMEPWGIAFDSIGNLFVVDRGNNCIRKVDNAGIITTFAGMGGQSQFGYTGDGGPAFAAQLNAPTSICVDHNQNIFVCDANNFRIRKISNCSSPLNVIINGGTTICGGSTDVLTASGASTFTWSANAGSAITNSVSVNPTTTTVYTVSGITGQCANRDTITVVVNPVLSIAGPTVSVCQGVNSVLTASGATNYTWSSNAGSAISNTVIVSPQRTTTYTVTGSAGGCISTQTVLVNVQGFAFYGNTYNYCSGGVTTLTVTGGGAPYTYTWSPNAGGINSDHISVTPTTNTTYTVSGNNGICPITDTITIFVGPGTAPNLVIAGPTVICQGSSALLVASGANTYTWSGNAGGSNADSVSVSPSTYTTYTVQGTIGTCTASASIALLIADSVAISGANRICNGDPTILFGSNAQTYTWMPGSINTNTISVSPSVNTTYTLLGSNGSCNSSDTITITVDQSCPLINTIVGTGYGADAHGDYYGDGGPALLAHLNYPSDIVFDKHGNYYIGDFENRVIWKVDTLGIIHTFAGTGGVSGYSGDGGPATLAKISAAQGLDIDSYGNIYFADFGNQVVRKIDTNNIITTVAGTGVTGNSGDGGPATSAKLNFPVDVAVDNAGNLFISDSYNSRIRKVNTSGIISTFVAASGFTPNILTLDNSGNIYCCDQESNILYKISPAGALAAFAGNGSGSYGSGGYSGDFGPATSGEINGPSGVTLDSVGNVYIADTWNHRIRKVDTLGIITTYAGNGSLLGGGSFPPGGFSGDGGHAILAKLDAPGGMAFDRNGNLFICDSRNQRIRIVGPAPCLNLNIAGSTAICLGSNSLLTATGATSYTWSANAGSVNSNTVNLNPASPTNYTVYGSNGSCTANKVVTLDVLKTPILTVAGANTIVCGATTTLTVKGATNYTWVPSNITNDTAIVSPYTNTTYSITGDNGCFVADTVYNITLTNCVWPGDANEDLIANNNDLLPIGLKFGQTGARRIFVSNSWQGYWCNNWPDTLSNGKNTKYANCNGDSIINFSDTLAVNLNYGQVHTLRVPPLMPQSLNPDVYLTFNKLLYNPGDTMIADVNIGSSTNIQTNFYGAAFIINYDNFIVKTGSESFYFNDSWIGTINQSKMKISKIISSTGQVDVGVVRITHSDTIGYGKVATLRFILKDTLSTNQMYFSISSGIKTDAMGNYSNLNAGTDSAAIAQNIGIKPVIINGEKLVIYPNPAKNHVYLKAKSSLEEITIVNTLGEVVLRIESKSNAEQIDVSKLAAGVYTIQCKNQVYKLVKE